MLHYTCGQVVLLKSVDFTKPIRSMTTFVLFHFVTKIKLPLVTAMDKSKFSTLLKEKKLTTFKVIMAELEVLIGPVAYLPVVLEMGQLHHGT